MGAAETDRRAERPPGRLVPIYNKEIQRRREKRCIRCMLRCWWRYMTVQLRPRKKSGSRPYGTFKMNQHQCDIAAHQAHGNKWSPRISVMPVMLLLWYWGAKTQAILCACDNFAS
ncbi:hypothetical protein EVAR_22240_1 [Eumeta japonica]|uniref:Uncharacterized protein n=1 Tax=Eumeta variegata TaxID=151549 RepID=A0A4C1UAH4_EUMVA|nr:hypothetical protein EVAR_22240_1 [Eumeta japonica]